MTLFDAAADGDPFTPEVRAITLVRLSALISRAATEIGRVAVEGEVHRPSTGTGRQWFTLKDRAAQVSVSIPSARRSRCRAVAGERVQVTGRLEWVPSWGQLQLVADEIVPVGAGAIAAMIEEARRRLSADGLLTRPRLPIPLLPAMVGVICGREAAVRADIESVVAARFPGYPVLFVETTVSGPGAPDNLIAAVQDLDARAEIEVIVLARGGGDATQLLPFSDEQLCRVVGACTTPVVAAIGHDGDRPLIDEVVDLRCGTPSLAAGAVIPDKIELRARLDAWLETAARACGERLAGAEVVLTRIDPMGAAQIGVDRAHSRLAREVERLVLLHPARELDRATARLARVGWAEPGPVRVAGAVRTLAAARAQVDALSPARVLERGYAVVRRAGDHAVVRAPADAAPGTALDVMVAAGRLAAVVTDGRQA